LPDSGKLFANVHQPFTVFLNRWHASSVGRQYGRELLRALQHGNLEILISEFTNNYICFYILFEARGLETKDSCLKEA